MKDSGIEWIGEIPSHWRVIKTKNKFTYKKEIVGNRVDLYERLSLTLNGVLRRSKDDTIGLQPQKFEGYQVLSKEELVFKLIDLENINTSRVGLSKFRGIVSPAYIVLSNPFESAFGYYYFYSMWQREVFNLIGGDGVRSALNKGDLLKIPYLDVPDNEKDSIVDYLHIKVTRINKIMRKTRSIIEDYKLLKQSIITEAVTKGLDKDVEMKDSGIEWIGEIPSSWKIIKLKYLLTERKEYSTNGIEEPLSMSQKFGVVPSKQLSSIPNPKTSYIGNRIVKTGDLVFNKLKAHLGVFSVADYFGIVSPDYAVYSSIGPVHLKYLEFLFKTSSYINEFKKRSTGVGQGLTRLYTNELFSIKCHLPPLDEQICIIEHLNEINLVYDNLIDRKLELIEQLEQYKKSLIYEYVTGKKEVE